MIGADDILDPEDIAVPSPHPLRMPLGLSPARIRHNRAIGSEDYQHISGQGAHKGQGRRALPKATNLLNRSSPAIPTMHRMGSVGGAYIS